MKEHACELGAIAQQWLQVMAKMVAVNGPVIGCAPAPIMPIIRMQCVALRPVFPTKVPTVLRKSPRSVFGSY
jgi:hypothetical protein